jgi:SAM-dependent methyltransferase
LAFQDHYSAYAPEYAKHRPAYPPRLFAFLASLSPGRDLAWDAGTGSGQAALGLAEHFGTVRATDPSQQQLAQAPRHPRVTYRVGDEGGSGLPEASCDLISAAQAAHWFDMNRFIAEARRVARADAIVAIWGYGLCTIDAGIDAILRRFYTEAVGAFWPAGRRHVDEAYRTLPFPRPEVEFPEMAIEARLDLADLGGYIRTWSAVHRRAEAGGGDVVAPLLTELAPIWGDPAVERPVRWPLFGRIGQVRR